jgi:hypothetical protein
MKKQEGDSMDSDSVDHAVQKASTDFMEGLTKNSLIFWGK